MAVAHGEIVAVMGPSGSGKSTLLHCLAGIFPPDSGEVWFDGRRLDTLERFRANPASPDRVRVRVPVREPGAGTHRRGQRRAGAGTETSGPEAAYQQAARWLDRLGLGDKGTRRTGELSGGEAQRVAVARALALGPQVLFADEPTGSLDSLTGEKVMDLLTGLAREQGVTVVVVTHDVRVAAYADRQVLVRDGVVTAGVRTGVGVIRLGLQLVLASGREALTRLLVITVAVAAGVALLLAVLAEFHAFQADSSRPCWECTQAVTLSAPCPTTA